jgi:hypothetical protein
MASSGQNLKIRYHTLRSMESTQTDRYRALKGALSPPIVKSIPRWMVVLWGGPLLCRPSVFPSWLNHLSAKRRCSNSSVTSGRKFRISRNQKTTVNNLVTSSVSRSLGEFLGRWGVLEPWAPREDFVGHHTTLFRSSHKLQR